jgi:hypothetical protein
MKMWPIYWKRNNGVIDINNNGINGINQSAWQWNINIINNGINNPLCVNSVHRAHGVDLACVRTGTNCRFCL